MISGSRVDLAFDHLMSILLPIAGSVFPLEGFRYTILYFVHTHLTFSFAVESVFCSLAFGLVPLKPGWLDQNGVGLLSS